MLLIPMLGEVDETKFAPLVFHPAEQVVVGSERVVWMNEASQPTYFDAVSSLLLDLFDGSASILQIATEAHEELAIPFETALARVVQAVATAAQAKILVDERVAPDVIPSEGSSTDRTDGGQPSVPDNP